MTAAFIQADDFSGVAEVGQRFAQQGLHTRLLLVGSAPMGGAGLDGGTTLGADAGVLVVDTHSRSLSPESAAERVAGVFSAPAANEARVLFKKIDSLWRGNIGAEIAAIAGLGYHTVIAGALPQLRRTVVDGRPFVDGAALDQTELWKAETSTPPADIPGLFSGSASAAEVVDLVDLAAVRSPGLALKLSGLLSSGSPATVVVDGETIPDLEAVVEALFELNFTAAGRRIVLVGTGAAADVLARRLGTGTARNAHFQAPAAASTAGAEATARPVLAVVGSASTAARRQLRRLEAEGFLLVELTLDELDQPEADKSRLRLVREELATGSAVAVTVAADAVDPTDAAKIVGGLAAFVYKALTDGPTTPDLILTGGETAREVLDAVGVHSLRPLNAVQHGAVVSLADDGRLIGTKPGSFGDDLALLQLHESILSQRAASAAGHPTEQRIYQPSERSGATMNPAVPNTSAVNTSALKTDASNTAAQDPRPIVAVTMGDGAGVGPEVVVAAVLDPQINAECRPVVIGDALRLRQAADILGIQADIQPVATVQDAVFSPGRVNVIDLALLPEDLPWGELSPVAGHAAYEYIRVASELAMAGTVQAICTAPLNKEALHAAGHIFPGHTELLAQLTGTEEVSMMLSTPKIKVIHVTTHIGLMDAVRKINPALVERTIRRGHEALIRAGIPQPKIGVCAINPHAGEGGLFGQGEEAEKIEPGVRAARESGIDVTGPLPADTLFFLAGRGDYDLVVAMYHDQGHGPVKVLGIEAGVNITVGLPVIRTSVDHGTAFDIAGKAIADSRSMVEALHQAAEMATRPSMAV